jgi:hypothetical protein
MRLRENTKLIRLFAPLALFCTVPLWAGADVAAPDTLFPKVHFDEWTGGKGQSPFKWTIHAQPVTLSNHQRWVAQVDVEIDGAEMEARRGKGALFVLFQFADANGRLYQDHGTLDLSKVQPGVRAQIIIYSESVFVTPGSYPMAIGVFDTNTREHWLKRETLRVPQERADPLPQAGRDLPPIEFVPHEESPDSWFLPTVTGKLHLPVETRHPVRIEILVNLTPSERVTDSQRIQDRNLGVLLPTMKVLAQMELTRGTLNVESLDLTRQKISFRQDGVRPVEGAPLNWPKMREALMGDQLGTIDVKSLGDREHSAQFFVTEVGKQVRATDVLIILSSSVRFEQGVDLQPMQYEGTPDCHVYYVRYHPPPVKTIVQPQQTPMILSRRAAPVRRGPVTVTTPPVVDQLEPTLKALRHRLFDVQTPEEMRRALADLLAEISVL